ncbi:SprT-like protein [Paenibacillus phyllosphaerae]|uniref:SprT-like protein n=1 Tax=Paenibacillus phyllosphaerae TaxID=274593 RepID=A0A7W5ATR0_9BACL|nr:SprT family protein [Paenibacillus phyllosphaerae]MBB3108502.1 SprT-like protein [Paenibacillus phyllosphaerae]
MNDDMLQRWVEEVSLRDFGRPFRHKATFNGRLKATGGRYFTKSHNIEISPHQLAAYGEAETEKIIKHELCHYHLHILKMGYQHRDADFKNLLVKVGGSRYCQQLPERQQRKPAPYKYKLVCVSCKMEYLRKRKVDPRRYACGKCRGKLLIQALDLTKQS